MLKEDDYLYALSLPESYQKYLFTILKVKKRNRNLSIIKNREIMTSLDIKAPSVTFMFNRLQTKCLIIYFKHKGVRLTAKGFRIAQILLEYHVFLEYILFKSTPIENTQEIHRIVEDIQYPYNYKLHMALKELFHSKVIELNSPFIGNLNELNELKKDLS